MLAKVPWIMACVHAATWGCAGGAMMCARELLLPLGSVGLACGAGSAGGAYDADGACGTGGAGNACVALAPLMQACPLDGMQLCSSRVQCLRRSVHPARAGLAGRPEFSSGGQKGVMPVPLGEHAATCVAGVAGGAHLALIGEHDV